MPYRSRANARFTRPHAGEVAVPTRETLDHLLQRDVPPPEPREACGERIPARDPVVRSTRLMCDVDSPAPLLMRLTRRKAVIEVGRVVRQ